MVTHKDKNELPAVVSGSWVAFVVFSTVGGSGFSAAQITTTPCSYNFKKEHCVDIKLLIRLYK